MIEKQAEYPHDASIVFGSVGVIRYLDFFLARPGFVDGWMLKKMQTFAHVITDLDNRYALRMQRERQLRIFEIHSCKEEEERG